MASQRGYAIVNEYTDRISGAKTRRPGLDQRMSDARRGKFDVVLVWASYRLAGRSSTSLMFWTNSTGSTSSTPRSDPAVSKGAGYGTGRNRKSTTGNLAAETPSPREVGLTMQVEI